MDLMITVFKNIGNFTFFSRSVLKLRPIRLGAEFDTVQTMKLTLRALTLTAAIALLGIAVGGLAAAGDAQMKLPRETLAADSESNFAQGNQLLHNGGSSQMEMQESSQKLEKLGAAGHLAVLDAGTQVQAMGGGTRVRVIGGPHAGQVWWLFTDEDVRKPGEVPPGAVEQR
jgi:hypothetical protein